MRRRRLNVVCSRQTLHRERESAATAHLHFKLEWRAGDDRGHFPVEEALTHNELNTGVKRIHWCSPEVGDQSRLRGWRAHEVGISVYLDPTGAVGERSCLARVDHRTM